VLFATLLILAPHDALMDDSSEVWGGRAAHPLIGSTARILTAHVQ
jgi:hypothetical protein